MQKSSASSQDDLSEDINNQSKKLWAWEKIDCSLHSDHHHLLCVTQSIHDDAASYLLLKVAGFLSRYAFSLACLLQTE